LDFGVAWIKRVNPYQQNAGRMNSGRSIPEQTIAGIAEVCPRAVGK